MSKVAAVIAKMRQLGIPPEQILEIVEAMEGEPADGRSAAAIRQARYRENMAAKKRQAVTCDVTCDVTETVTPGQDETEPRAHVVIPNLPSEDISKIPPKTPPNGQNVTPAETAKRAKRPKPDATELDAQLAELRAAYPRRTGGDPPKTAAAALARALAGGADLAAIVEGARAYARSRDGEDPRFIAMLATWLNQERWKLDYSGGPGGPRLGTMSRIALEGFGDEFASAHDD